MQDKGWTDLVLVSISLLSYNFLLFNFPLAARGQFKIGQSVSIDELKSTEFFKYN